MRPILSEDDLAIALSAERAVIYFFVEWSVYAVQGRQRFGEWELLYGCEPEMSFWVADVSDVEPPAVERERLRPGRHRLGCRRDMAGEAR